MRKAVRILPILILALSLSAQLQTGDVRGRVLDKAGKPLSGVKVTLSRPLAADQKTVTGASGVFRFLSVFPGPDYSIKAELAGHKTALRATLAVIAGKTSPVELTLEPGKEEETVTVAAATPTIDRGEMTAGARFGPAELQTLPTTRDPWAILQLVPAVMLDRDNVGGNESSAQARAVTKGDMKNGTVNVWTIDGVDVTDAASLGASAIDFDFDAIDTIAVTTGGAAGGAQQTGGIAVNLLTRRGGNKIGATAHLYLTDNAFQSSNMTSDLWSKGIPGTNKIQRIKDYGVSAGGPLLKNRIWWWGAYGGRDYFTYTIYNTKDQTYYGNYSFKLNAMPFKGNQFEALFMTASKEKFGENASAAKPEGDHLSGRYALGNPIYKLQDEQTIGNDFHLSLKYYSHFTGTLRRPTVDEGLSYPATWDVEEGAYVAYSPKYGRSWDWASARQAHKGFQLAATFFREDLLGMDHEFKGGFAFAGKEARTEAGLAQNFEVFRNFVDPLIDLGEGLVVPPSDYQYIKVYRDSRDLAMIDVASAYLQDTISLGRLTLTLGFRYDRQTPSTGAYNVTAVKPFGTAWKSLFDNYAMGAIDSYLPALSIRAIDPKYQWSTWSPRIGLSWDLSGDGRTVAKLALSQYGDILAAGANTPRPLGVTGGMGFWWYDTDADGIIDLQEMLWRFSPVHAETPYQLYAIFNESSELTTTAFDALEGGFASDAYLAGNYWDYDWWEGENVNYDNLTTFYRSDIDPGAKNVKTSPRTREVMLGLERELGADLAASVTATFRRFDNFKWAKPFYPADIYPATPDLVIDNTQTWYVAAGTVPEKVTIDEVEYDLKDAAGKTWYLPSADYPGETPYRMIDKSTAFWTYLGLDLNVTKRLSRRWFMNASLTLQDQRAHWGESYIDQTNQWALDGKPYGNWSGGSYGKTSVQMYARWLARVSALYELPWGFNVSGTLVAREGWKVPNYITLAFANEESWEGLYRSNTVFIQAPTVDRLPNVANLSLRLEKTVKLGAGRMAFMFDVFNVLNAATILRSYDANIGTYYVDTEVGVANPTYRLSNEILNPRVFRLGVRFDF